MAEVTRELDVMLVHGGDVVGGAEKWQLALSDATPEAAWSVLILGGRGEELRREWTVRGRPVHGLPASPRHWGMLQASRAVLHRVTATRPDVVVAHGVKGALVAVPAHLLVGVPLVWVRHDDSFSRTWARLLRLVVSAQVSTSARLEALGGPRNHLVLPPPARRPTPRQEVPGTGTLVLGVAGRLVPYKGFDDAIRAVALTGGSWHLVVYGIDDPAYPQERERLLALAANMGVTEQVSIKPPVPELVSVMHEFDAVAVLTRPSPADGIVGEGFGMVALEAMGCGVPVLATPPVQEWAGTGCMTVRAADPQSVAQALRTLADPAIRTQLAQAGLRRAANHPDAATTGAAYVEFLADLVHRRGAGRPGEVPISIVSTVRDESSTIGALLEAVSGQMRERDEFVLVDAGSTDGTWEVLCQAAQQDPRIRVLSAPGAGISRGRNIGIEAARNSHIACTDAGCRPDPGWLGAFRSAMTLTPGDALWCGTYDVDATTAMSQAHKAVGYPDLRHLEWPTPLASLHGRLFGRAVEADRPTGRSVAFTKDLWAAVGGFPTEYQTGEDVLFGQRAVQAGFPAMVVRDARVLWFQRDTLAATARMFYRYGLASGQTRHWPLLGRDLVRAAAYPVGVAALLTGRRTALPAALAAAAYLSVPLARAGRSGGVSAAVLVPAVSAVRDVAKAAGALAGLAGRKA